MGVLARTCMKSFQAVAECFLKAVFLDGLSPLFVYIYISIICAYIHYIDLCIYAIVHGCILYL